MQELQEKRVQSLGWEDALEEDVATHSSILAWRIPMDRAAWRAVVHRVSKSQTQLKQLNTYTSSSQIKYISNSPSSLHLHSWENGALSIRLHGRGQLGVPHQGSPGLCPLDLLTSADSGLCLFMVINVTMSINAFFANPS